MRPWGGRGGCCAADADAAVALVDEFLTLAGGGDRSGADMEIRRLPSPWTTVVPEPGATLPVGETVVVDICPVEGGVTVHVDGIEVLRCRSV